MYLKTIEIVGFKSFPERTRIEVKPGITGVIGPNGCGKSNIMESIRWCIGEMSWKALRSNSMVNVIFAGTERRNPMNLAEVTLTFDNTSSRLALQYSEVQVSRRIFRSGESEYYLNKTQCRLRDIRELFLDTGIGNSGYAIIDQGQVDFVLSSKPEDRRALFEEAAGVSKYKAKRQEALRKLDRLEIDLGRLQDSVSLIDEQIKKLDSDARKTKLFQKYKAELASQEAGQILKEVGEIEAELAAESERIAPLGEKLSALHSSIDADEARQSALNLEVTAANSAAMECGQRIAALKSEIGRLEERIENAKNNRADLENQVKASTEAGEIEKGRSAELDPPIAEAEADLAAAEERLEAARIEHEEYRVRFDSLVAERDGAAEALDEVRRERLNLSETRQEASREHASAEGRIHQFEYQLTLNRKENDKKAGAIAEAREFCAARESAASEAEARVSQARGHLAGLDSGREGLRARLDSVGDEAMAVHAESAALAGRIEALEAQGGRDPYWVGAHAVVDSGIPGVMGTVRSLFRVADENRGLIEDALGERLYAVVCADASAARLGVDFLKGCGKGRARFLIADSLNGGESPAPSLPEGARSLLDLVESDPGRERIMRHLLAESYAHDGALHGRHWVCGGSRDGESPQLSLSDVDSLKADLSALGKKREGLSDLRASLAAEIEETDTLREESRRRREEEDASLQKIRLELDHAREGLKGHEEDFESLEAEAERIRADRAKAKEDMDAAAGKLTQIRGREGELIEAEADSAKKYADLGAEVLKREAQAQQLRNNREHLAGQRDLARERLGAKRSEKESVENQIRMRAEQEARWGARIEEYAAVMRESAETLDRLHRDLADGEKEAAGLREDLQVLRNDAESVTAKLRAEKADAETLQNDLHASELKVSQRKSRGEFLRKRLAEEWELTYEEARERFQEQPVDDERIQFLRRRIASLGNINMAAPEEYDELTKKRDYLQGQIDDLNQAKQDLRSVITKINATTRENFRQTFHEVREHFRKLYGVLFDGGEADLILTDQENLLETGIEVVAQPPGKRLQSISQLSGGEKTLTAIALLFGFFMVRPSPMCMLDEADAALDDANVERFVSMLREFSDRTQFLIVSHNKKTMEACDAIYGITMEESGVSQIISVELKKREGKAKLPPRAERPLGENAGRVTGPLSKTFERVPGPKVAQFPENGEVEGRSGVSEDADEEPREAPAS